MHCEKNLCENLMRTLLGEMDGVKSREDMRVKGIRSYLHLQQNADGLSYFMHARRTLCIDQRRMTRVFCNFGRFEVPK